MSAKGICSVVGWITLGLLTASPAAAQNYALNFQPINSPYAKDHLRLSDHPAVGDEFTVEFWMAADDSIPFCATEADAQGCWSTSDTWFYGNFIFDGHQNFEQNPGRDSFDIVLSNSGRLKVVLGPNEEQTDGTSDVVTGGNWHHVAVVREWFGANDHRVRLFVDGQLEAEQVLAGRDTFQLIFPYWGTERADWAGAVPDAFPDYHGRVDEIRYWSVARTQSEIQATMNVELAGDESGLVHYLRLNEGQGRLAHDMRSDNDGIFYNLQAASWVASTAPVAQQPGPDCGDGVQNQGEVGVDCGGPCFACPPLSETVCDDGIDEDLDGPVDCDDDDCAADQVCAVPDGVYRVAADDRDADWNAVDGVLLGNFFNSGQICLGRDGARGWELAVQFAVTLPLPVTVTGASLTLTSSGDGTAPFAGQLHTIDADDVAPFVPGNPTAFSTAYTLSAPVAWTPPVLPAGQTVQSPELLGILQPVLDRPGRVSGNRIGFVVTGSAADGEWNCFEDRAAGLGGEAELQINYLTQGAPLCLDARGGVADLRVLREPGAGCPLAPGGPARDFIFGEVGDLDEQGGAIDLGPIRCAGGAFATTDEVIRSADPDLLPGSARFYLVRNAGAPDFGNARLVGGATAPRTPGATIACP